MTDLLCLPEHVLELIVARTATNLSGYETCWGGAALACKRLHRLQLPGDFAVIEELQSERPVLRTVRSRPEDA